MDVDAHVGVLLDDRDVRDVDAVRCLNALEALGGLAGGLAGRERDDQQLAHGLLRSCMPAESTRRGRAP